MVLIGILHWIQKFLLTWKKLKHQVDGFELIQIPRWIGAASKIQWSLHGFADASKRAYSASIYFVPVIARPFFICSKTKVSLVNTQSITILELMAAQLLAHLIEYITPSLVNSWIFTDGVILVTCYACLKVFQQNPRLSKQIEWVT